MKDENKRSRTYLLRSFYWRSLCELWLLLLFCHRIVFWLLLACSRAPMFSWLYSSHFCCYSRECCFVAHSWILWTVCWEDYWPLIFLKILKTFNRNDYLKNLCISIFMLCCKCRLSCLFCLLIFTGRIEIKDTNSSWCSHYPTVYKEKWSCECYGPGV